MFQPTDPVVLGWSTSTSDILANLPTSAKPGDMYWPTDRPQTIYRYSGTLWQRFGPVSEIGPIASRPTSGMTAGDRYSCTDSPYEFTYDGSSWQAFVFGCNVVEPILSAFTQVNVGLTTLHTSHGGISMYAASQGNNQHQQVLAQAIPASGAYYVDAACVSMILPANGGVSLGFSDSTTTSCNMSLGEYGFESGNSFYWERKQYSGVTNWNSNAGQISPLVFNSPLLWLRVYDDRSSTRSFYISPNGYDWVQLYSESRTSLFTPAYVVLHRSFQLFDASSMGTFFDSHMTVSRAVLIAPQENPQRAVCVFWNCSSGTLSPDCQSCSGHLPQRV